MNHIHPTPMPLYTLPAHIKDRYRRLALVTHESHANLVADDDETMIVSCDWLLWQALIRAGRHAVHYELGILDWGEQDTMATDLYIRANDWIYETGEDLTFFRGVSLGRMFGSEMNMALLNYHRINRSLKKLIERFDPEEIWFFDFALDINLLSNTLRKAVVETVVRDTGVAFINRSGEVPPEAHEPGEEVYVRKEHGRLARWLLAVYAGTLETGSRLRCLFSSPRQRVLVLVNSNMAASLILNFRSGLTPMFQGRTVPKKPAFLWHCFRHGILLVTPWRARLDATDRQRLRAIRDELQEAFSEPSTGVLQFSRTYFRLHVLETGRLEEMVRQVNSVERLLDRFAPARIVIDSSRSTPPLIYAELARIKGICVDYIWHSTPLLHNKKLEILGGDPRCPPSVSRCLTWGRGNEKWLDNVGARAPRVRVGSPLADKYAGSPRRAPLTATRVKGKNILLLQYTYQIEDLAGLNTNMYENFVSTILELRKLGYKNFRFKLHPGPGRWKKSYFEKIARYYDLGCEVFKAEPFHEFLAWADIVIGPAATGAIYEALAAGRPYYAFLLSPHTLDPGYYEGFPLLTSVDHLSRALAEDAEPDGSKLLEDLYSIDEIASPSRRFWEVLESDFAGPS